MPRTMPQPRPQRPQSVVRLKVLHSWRLVAPSMRTLLMLLCTAATLLIAVSCSAPERSGSRPEAGGSTPPQLSLTVDGETVPWIAGGYQWNGATTDIAGPLQLAEHAEPLVAKPAAKLRAAFNYAPSRIELTAWKAAAASPLFSGQTMSGGEAALPEQPGRYIYALTGQWKEGHAQFVFVVDVR